MRQKQGERTGNSGVHKHHAHTGTDILRAKPKECKRRQRSKGGMVTE
jgi:hypothetical protein